MFNFAFPAQTALRQAVTDAYRRDEIEAVQDMLQRAQMSDEERQAASELARRLVTQVRASVHRRRWLWCGWHGLG